MPGTRAELHGRLSPISKRIFPLPHAKLRSISNAVVALGGGEVAFIVLDSDRRVPTNGSMSGISNHCGS